MAGRCVKTLLLSTALLNCVSGGPNCDSAIEANLCPDAFSLEELGTCLTAKKSELDENCALFVEINNACESALTRCGGGIAWGSDSIPCVTQWTRADDLTADCADVLVKIESDSPKENEREETEASKAKKAKRKAARKAAVNDVKKLEAEKEKASKKAADKKAKRKADKQKSRKERSKDDDEL